METIVVPTDLTPIADRALSVAVGLARTYQAENQPAAFGRLPVA